MRCKEIVLFVFALGMVLFVSCTKQRAPSKPTGPDYASPATFYTQYQQKVQTFQVDSPGTGFIVGKMGTRLTGDASIFMYPNGQNVVYPFTLQLIEVYTGKDMILSNLPSLGGGKILQTMGEISVNAFKGSQQLVLRPGKKYFMELDTNKSLLSGMSVFYGVSGGSITDWTVLIPDTLSAVINYPFFYAMNIARMGWVSCAQNFNPGGATTTIDFTSAGTNIQNIDVFLVFKDIHSVVQVYGLKSQVAIPVGTNLTVVAISRDANSGNSMVYDSQAITVGAGQQVTLNMKNISDVALLNALSAYN